MTEYPVSQTAQTVGETAALNPAAIRVFEKYNIDYCCGGATPLDRACQARGLDQAALRAEIERSAQPQEEMAWSSLSELARLIVSRHHAYLRTNLPRIDALMAKVLEAHGARYDSFLQPLSAEFQALAAELDAHLMKEEHILFPMIETMEASAGAAAGPPSFHCGSVRNPIRVMCMEHDSAGGALARMRELTSNYVLPEGACNTFRALYFELEALEKDLHQHIHLENNILFPQAIEMEAK